MNRKLRPSSSAVICYTALILLGDIIGGSDQLYADKWTIYISQLVQYK